MYVGNFKERDSYLGGGGAVDRDEEGDIKMDHGQLRYGLD
jgi:hypothetical protein